MKHHSQDATFPINYTFPNDVDYIPAEGDNIHSPYRESEISLLRARIELEDREITAPQWVIESVNMGAESNALLLRQYEDWLAKEAAERAMDRADCRFHAWRDERRTA